LEDDALWKQDAAQFASATARCVESDVIPRHLNSGDVNVARHDHFLAARRLALKRPLLRKQPSGLIARTITFGKLLDLLGIGDLRMQARMDKYEVPVLDAPWRLSEKRLVVVGDG
jgi:hypothetical protein